MDARFEDAFKTVKPMVKWENIGGLTEIKEMLEMRIIRRIKNPEAYEEFNIELEMGFFLYGPMGCGKVLLANGLANEAGASFMPIQPPDFWANHLGEPELAMRSIFIRARACAPCILLFDRFEAFAPIFKEGKQDMVRGMYELLKEMENAVKGMDVYVFGATDRPDLVDPVVLRRGGFENHIYVPLPTPGERGMILEAIVRTKQYQIDDNIDLKALGTENVCEGLSGADLNQLISEAALIAREELPPPLVVLRVTEAHIRTAFRVVRPSVGVESIELCEQFRQSLGGSQ